MHYGLIALCAAYILSQFYRAFLAVLSGPLEAELGVTAAQLSSASGLWFLIFAAMQIPVGWALDTLGPRRTSSALFLFGAAGGAAVFGLATAPWHITLAMALIGIGCSPVLMASYFILAKEYSAARFATMAGLIIAIGSLGNIGASIPMTLAVEALGWRGAMWALASATALMGFAVWVCVRDPQAEAGGAKGSVLDLLRMPALWLLFPLMFVNYAPAAGLRGLWVAPYFREVHGLSEAAIGSSLLVMGLAMIAGAAIYGPLERLFKTRKWVIIAGNLGSVISCAVFAMTAPGPWVATAYFAMIGIFGATFAVMIAHARSFVPPHLTGRGVTLLNLFGIGGVGVFQSLSGRVYEGAGAGAAAYPTLFAFFAGIVFLGLIPYLFSQDRLD